MYVIVKVMMVRVDLVMLNLVVPLIQAKAAWLMREKVAPAMQVKVVNAIQGLEAAGLARQFVLSVIRYYRISLESDLNFGCAASRNHSKRTDSVFNNHTSDCSNLVSAVS